MPTPRETILAALHARLSALPATALRGEVLPERVPAEGLLILRDGEPGEPEVTLSPLRYHYQHRAEIETVVQGATRDAAHPHAIRQHLAGGGAAAAEFGAAGLRPRSAGADQGCGDRRSMRRPSSRSRSAPPSPRSRR